MPSVDTVASWETSAAPLVRSICQPNSIGKWFVAESASFVRAVGPLPHPVITCLVMTLGGYRFVCCIPPGLQMLEDDIDFLRHEFQL